MGATIMRLWHESLIPKLPRQQLLGQHRECCALRGRGWGRNHSVVNYVFEHEPERLVAYHFEVMDEMRKRGYNPDPIWYAASYRGSFLGNQPGWANINEADYLRTYATFSHATIYPEHNDEYLQECIDNLKGKGIEI
jgi:uncharacterized protein (TIGR02328 family)